MSTTGSFCWEYPAPIPWGEGARRPKQRTASAIVRGSSMKLTIIRHAIAVPAGTDGVADDERPLTSKGRRRFEKVARGLAEICDGPDVLLTSPLPRATETADIAAQAWGDVTPTSDPALAQGDVDQ